MLFINVSKSSPDCTWKGCTNCLMMMTTRHEWPFPRYWPCLGEILRLPVYSPNKSSVPHALMYRFTLNKQLSCDWVDTPWRLMTLMKNIERLLKLVCTEQQHIQWYSYLLSETRPLPQSHNIHTTHTHTHTHGAVYLKIHVNPYWSTSMFKPYFWLVIRSHLNSLASGRFEFYFR